MAIEEIRSISPRYEYDCKKDRRCVTKCGEEGTWRYQIKVFVCPMCYATGQFKVMCRSRAQDTFGVSFEQLDEARKAGKLQMFIVNNSKHGGYPMHLYYVTQLEAAFPKKGTWRRAQEPLPKGIKPKTVCSSSSSSSRSSFY